MSAGRIRRREIGRGRTRKEADCCKRDRQVLAVSYQTEIILGCSQDEQQSLRRGWAVGSGPGGAVTAMHCSLIPATGVGNVGPGVTLA